MSSLTCFFQFSCFFSQFSFQQSTDQRTCNSTYDPDNDSSILAQEKTSIVTLCRQIMFHMYHVPKPARATVNAAYQAEEQSTGEQP